MTVLQVMQSSQQAVAQIKKRRVRGCFKGQPPDIFLLDQEFVKNRKLIFFSFDYLFNPKLDLGNSLSNMISVTARPM
jgi:hypothetical protein